MLLDTGSIMIILYNGCWKPLCSSAPRILVALCSSALLHTRGLHPVPPQTAFVVSVSSARRMDVVCADGVFCGQSYRPHPAAQCTHLYGFSELPFLLLVETCSLCGFVSLVADLGSTL